ncbi:MAG TPA: hypothetical protein VGF96_04615 [Terracidiphilus sp.]|jgi:hypothetical protein
MVAIAVGEIAGLLYFREQFLRHPSYGERALTGFLILSLMSIALIVPYLWSDWLLQRQIKYFEVVLVVVLGPATFLKFHQGKEFQAILNGMIALVALTAILPRLFGSERMPSRGADRRIAEDSRNESSPFAARNLGGRYFGMLLVWLVATELSFSHTTAPISFSIKALFALPALWLAWESLFQFSEGMRDRRSAKAAGRKANTQRGRA